MDDPRENAGLMALEELNAWMGRKPSKLFGEERPSLPATDPLAIAQRPTDEFHDARSFEKWLDEAHELDIVVIWEN